MTRDLTDKREPFQVNDRVSHELFGEGYVEKISAGSSGYYHVDVAFDEPYQVRETAPSTRFRKLVSTYLEKIDAPEVPSEETLNIEGLEGTDMVEINPQKN